MTTDLINIEELKNLYGKESAMELLEMSLGEARSLIDSLKKSIPEMDFAQVGADAHQLKGMAATMTMMRLSELSYKLEQCAKNKSCEGAEQLLESMESCYQEIVAECKELGCNA